MYTCTGLKCVQKGRCQDVDDDLLEEWGWQGSWRCLVYAFYILCKLSLVSTSYIHERETTWKSLSSATAWDLSCLLLLAGPAFLCRGVLEPLFLPALSVTFQTEGALAWPWARGFHCNVSPNEGSHLFTETTPPALSIIAPSLEKIPHTPFVIFIFGVLEVNKRELREESRQTVALHFQSDYFFGSHLLTLGVLAASEKFGSLLAHPWGRFLEIALETLKWHA